MSLDLVEREKAEEDLQKVESFFVELLEPSIFTQENHRNAVVVFENNYNSLCAALETAGHKTKDITVMELYAKLKHFKDVNSPSNG